MDDVAWSELVVRVAAAVAALADRQFVVVEEPTGEPGPPVGLLRRRTPPPPTRFTQVLRLGDQWRLECVGAQLFGGDWDVDPPTHEAVRALGWLAPGDPDDTGTRPAVQVYWRTLPVGDAAAAGAAAALLVGALRVLGAGADDVTLRTGGP